MHIISVRTWLTSSSVGTDLTVFLFTQMASVRVNRQTASVHLNRRAAARRSPSRAAAQSEGGYNYDQV